ncbi:putative JAB1 Mov34 MPN PAD 1 ubiquitin protease Maintenance of mitochondrial structure and function [Trypanosoma vivax]|uniref:JAB1/MPN/MOV34 metalloenzyme domain-containing protein n=1 Tax=Trypanosoma vivax (strain Y486) TaxID=1055687 RepID=G0U0U5_TRYVY|nr:hypothetical protein TRVL_07313 [Trypanosoma vivax]KAH8608128.1 putative JAB1 Mov34 MPN PAD 1 ubiquitin protease Maintenance of mitochondrial structure and function [Trypanosoma vivax]CCC49696.1 conserved hypothetical protein [Trypanosoma vivax Y486]
MGDAYDGVASLHYMATEEPFLPVHLHPLVVLSITNHVTRAQCDMGVAYGTVQDLTRVIGVLLGKTTDSGEVEIVSSYEMVGKCLLEPGGGWAIDWPAVKRKRERLVEVYPELTVVGWYGIGGLQSDLIRCCSNIHVPLCETFEEVHDKRIFSLMLDPSPRSELTPLPAHIFEVNVLYDYDHSLEQDRDAARCESGSLMGSGAPFNGSAVKIRSRNSRLVVAATNRTGLAVELKHVQFIMDSDEIIHTGLDAALNGASSACPSGWCDAATAAPSPVTMAPQLRRIEHSLCILKQHAQLVTRYLKAVESGEITQWDSEVLRCVNKVCAMLPDVPVSPSPSSEKPHVDMFSSLTNADQSWYPLLLSLLSIQTKCATALEHLNEGEKKHSAYS